MIKEIKYAIKMIPLFAHVRNWRVVFSSFFKLEENKVYLKSGVTFKIKHFLDLLIIKEIFIDGEYDIALKNPRYIIDVGANIGDSALFFSKKFPQSKIFAFEPAKSTFEILKYNLRINKVSNVVAHNIGIGSQKRNTTFYVNSASGLSSLFDKRKNTKREKVKLDTLENIFTKNKINKCDLLKMDCEGAEYDILFNMSDSTLDKIKAIVMEYHETLTDFKLKHLIKFLRKNNFKLKVKKHQIENDIGIIFARKHND